ncbi:MAG: zinc-ribbon domain-containing protein [Candidatus Spyradocola sp.]
MFCTKCGANIPDNMAFCPQCGAATGSAPNTTYAPPTPPPPQPLTDDEIIVKRIRDNARACAVLWLIIGIVQTLACATIVAGVWNIVMAARELKSIENIQVGNRAVYDAYDKALNMNIAGTAINLFLGAVFGCVLSGFEFYIRDQVIKNHRVFGA